ncbi:MAG: hypothetical protein LBE77_10740 [Fluviicola sp.]|nr:hypothetical protein [Fluviicola sp.]
MCRLLKFTKRFHFIWEDLRSLAIELPGFGLGSLPKEDLNDFFTTVFPEVFDLVQNGKLKLHTWGSAFRN